MGASLLLCARLLAMTIAGENLTPRWSGDQLLISAPKLHFLSGKPLERLRNGAAVPFDFQLTVSAGSRTGPQFRSLARFVVSYDLWEERFSVVRLRSERKPGVHMTAAQAEAWCMDSMSVPTSSLQADQNLWLRLEIRAAESKPVAALPDDGGANLSTLVEIFSRPTRNPQDHWALETGPFTLSAVRR